MSEANKVWLKTPEQKIKSLIADEAKASNMLDEMQSTIKQLRSKSSFRLALLNSLQEEYQPIDRENRGKH